MSCALHVGTTIKGEKAMKKVSLLTNLKRKGFDESYKAKDGGYRVRCSRCEAVVLNGVPVHEQGCSNEKNR